MSKINNLVDRLREASKRYYTDGTSLMTDEEYDAGVKILMIVDPDNPYLKEIGPSPECKKISHILPMGTLSKYHTENEIGKWIESVGESKFVISPKYDGFGVELVYRSGDLISASTRGTGHMGEDISDSVKNISNIPHHINTDYDILYIRGEAIIPRSNSKEIKSRGYVSLRNAVPGIVRSCDLDNLQYVDFVAYGVYTGDPNTDSSKTTSEWRCLLDTYGFRVEDYEVCDSFLEMNNVYNSIQSQIVLGTSPYEYDGVVIKTETIHPDDDLLTPTYQVAWKFQSKIQVTRLVGVSYQVGNTGKFTPIAEFEPVVFQGATLTRASLGSYSRFKSLISDGLKIGCFIEVTRNGDIIPYVRSVCPDIVEDTKDIDLLSICPHCGTEITFSESGEAFCKNKGCNEVLALKITYYLKSIQVKGLGRGLIDKLLSAGLVRSISDLYTVSDDKLSTVQGVGRTTIEKFNIFKERRVSIRDLFTAYPFENCGVALWKKFDDEQLLNLVKDTESVTSVKGVSTGKMSDIKEQITYNKEDLTNLITYMTR